jgi:hypothetical protein
MLATLLFGLSLARAQDSTSQEPPAAPPQPAPAYGPDTTVPSIAENPPISGLDLPNLEPHAAPLSYLQPGAHVSESVDSNIENSLGGSSVQSLTRAEGSLELHRLWSNYDLSLDYLGGIGYYNVPGIGVRQIEELGFEQKISWKRGQLGIRDAFSYQPEGTFGSAYGATGETGAGLSGLSAFFPGSALGALGQVPRITNVSLVDVVENLTPRSSITASGGYGFAHFLGNDPNTGTTFIGNTEVTGQMGYSRILGPHDQAALVYGYQGFSFSTGLNFHTHLIQAMWGHRISGRMDFLVGAGPQFTQLNHLFSVVSNPMSADTIPPCQFAEVSGALALECPGNDLRISAAGRALFRYRFPKTSLDLSYDHFITGGSGFFAGAESDIVSFGATRPLGRVWTGFTNIGYSRNSRVLPLADAGVNADTYQYGFAGAGLHRMFGRSLRGYVSYQFNELSFDSSFCGGAASCNRISQRHVGTIGLDWTPRPVRLD